MALQQQSPLLFLLLLCISVVCSLRVPSPSANPSASVSSPTAASVTSITERQHLSQVKALVVHLINSQTAPSTVGVSAAAVTASVRGTGLHNGNNNNNLNNGISSNSSSLPTSSTTTLHLVNSSSSSLNAISTLCTENQTFWDQSVGACVKCSSACPANAYIERQCNRTHDLECTCHKGWYMSVVDKTCKPCAQCPTGWGVWRTCRWSRNTVCRKCQPGTYSGSNVGTLGCIPCSKCGPNQEAITECDGNRDTICVDRAALRANFSQYFPELAERSSISASLLNQLNAEVGLLEQDEQHRAAVAAAAAASAMSSASSSPSYSRHLHHHQHRNHLSSSPYSTKTPSTVSSGGGLSGQNALPFYFAILVIVVFSVCIYALVQLRCSEVLITGRSLEAACAAGAHVNGGGDRGGRGGAAALLATQAEQKAHLMMDSGFSGSPGGAAVMIPQVVTTISSPYYHSYSHHHHHQQQHHHPSPYQHVPPSYSHHHFGNNNNNNNNGNSISGGNHPNYQNWNAKISREEQPAQAPSFSTVMHLYTASAQRQQQQTASSDVQPHHRVQPGDSVNRGHHNHHHHHKFNPRPKPTYKAYYELLFAPEDMREEEEEEEKVKVEEAVDSAESSAAVQQKLPSSVIDSLIAKLASDCISWRMLASQLGYDDKQVAQLERKSTPTTTTTAATAAATSEQQQASRTRVTTGAEEEVEKEKTRKAVIHDMLTDWCRREMGQKAEFEGEAVIDQLRWPVSTLQGALTSIGRVDCARLLQQALNTAGSCSSSLSTSMSSCASTCASSQALS